MIAEEGDFLRPLVRAVIQEFLEAEMAEAVGAEKGERVEGRLSYRSGYYTRSLVTRVGKLELIRQPPDPGSQRTIFHGDLRGLPAQREGTGSGIDADVHPGGIDPEAQSGQRRALRPQFQSERD
jgi:Transposase, Mutator family